MPAAAPAEPATPAKDAGGTVTVRGRFAVDGSVAEVRVIFSEPAGKFDAVALRSIKTWRVTPWWPKGAKQGREFGKTLNFFDDKSLRDATETVPIAALDPSGVSLDDRTGNPKVIAEGRYRARPNWPPAARSPERGGWVRMKGEVDVDGRVTKLDVVASHPPGLFDAVSLGALRKWRFNKMGEGDPTVPRPFHQIFLFDVGVTTVEMMQAQYLTLHRDAARQLLAELAALCPDQYLRADDPMNRALASAPRKRPLPSGPVPELPDATPDAVELMLRYGGCPFSSREQLTDPRAYRAAANIGWFDHTLGPRSGDALCERAVALGMDPAQCYVNIELNDSDRLLARRWIAARFAEAYQMLIAQDPRAVATPLEESTRAALAEAKKARLRGERHEPVTVLVRAIKRAKRPEDVAILRLALARVYLDIGSRGDAYEEILKLLGSAATPWYARQMARVMLLVTYEGWHDEGGDEFQRTVAALNEELGVGEKVKY